MGLDIIYCSKLTPAVGNEAFDSTGELGEEWRQIYVNPDFPGRAAGLKHQHAYKADTEEYFRAGSYSGYNAWRECLAVLAGYPDGDRGHASSAWQMTGGPFWELINFSDCEGTIGPAMSSKLAQDFAEFQDKADQHEDEWFKKLYGKWRVAFETAADGGCVIFC
jgi:hypothetical protein